MSVEYRKCISRLYDATSVILDVIFVIDRISKNQENKVGNMDKKMHQVTKRMATAVKDIKKGEPKKAEKVLKKAEKKNEKLVKIDRDVRDPLIEKCKKMMPKKKLK